MSRSRSLTPYLLHRLALLVPTLFGISLLVFALMRCLPGDVVQVMIGAEAQLGAEQRATLTGSWASTRRCTSSTSGGSGTSPAATSASPCARPSRSVR